MCSSSPTFTYSKRIVWTCTCLIIIYAHISSSYCIGSWSKCSCCRTHRIFRICICSKSWSTNNFWYWYPCIMASFQFYLSIFSIYYSFIIVNSICIHCFTRCSSIKYIWNSYSITSSCSSCICRWRICTCHINIPNSDISI